MYFIVHTSDNRTYHSDTVDFAESVKDSIYNTAEEAIEAIESTFKNMTDLTSFRMIINGRDRHFNPTHIVWVELVRD